MEEGVEQSVTLPDDMRGARADKVMAGLYPEISRSRWQKLFRDGRVWREDFVLSQKQTLRAGMTITFTIPPPTPLELSPVAMDLSILHEDQDILVIDKDPGVVVHPGAGTAEDTLVHGLLHHCKGSLSGIGGAERPGIVHRLDKETSGVIIIAKSEKAFASLAEQFAARSLRKTYTALVVGELAKEGSVDEPIRRHPTLRTRMTCGKGGRNALTRFHSLEHFGKAATLVELEILTGRTHQIRVHMKHLGHSLLGDSVYGYKEKLLMHKDEPIKIPRVMLHATRLEIDHPITGERITFEAPLRGDFNEVIDVLRTNWSTTESH